MRVFKNTKERFYLIVLLMILLFCGAYLQLAVFLNKLKSSSEAGLNLAIINYEIKELEKEFWKLRFWEQSFHIQRHPDAEKQFEITIGNLIKRIIALNPKPFTKPFSEKIEQISALLIRYKEQFNLMRHIEIRQRLNLAQIRSSYQLVSSALLISDEKKFIRSVRNLDKFLNAYLQNRGDSEYQEFRMILEFLKKSISESEFIDTRIESYIIKLNDFTQQHFELEKKTREISKGFNEISIQLSHFFLHISDSAENLSKKAISESGEVRYFLQQQFIITSCLAFLLLFLIINMMAKKIIGPIRQISNIVKEFQAGNELVRFSSENKDEISELGFALNETFDTINQHHYHLERLVKERTQQLYQKNMHLKQSIQRVETANKKVIESIHYSKKIQRSLLPNMAVVRTFLPESFFIWGPKDIVGGDIFFAESLKDGFIVAVIDCTGHGVPGAFMTMIASAALKRVIKDDGCHDPAQILKRMNHIVKTTLQQDTEDASSDDGMDAAIIRVRSSVNHNKSSIRSEDPLTNADSPKLMTFAGAKIPLFYAYNGKLTVIKGDRQSIGYKQSRRSDINFNFTNQTINIKKGMNFYIATDGFEDQLGNNKESRFGVRRFGSKQFRKLIQENSHLPFATQRKIILKAFHLYKGNQERQDDLTLVGFGF